MPALRFLADDGASAFVLRYDKHTDFVDFTSRKSKALLLTDFSGCTTGGARGWAIFWWLVDCEEMRDVTHRGLLLVRELSGLENGEEPLLLVR